MGGKYDRHQLRDRWYKQASMKQNRNVGKFQPDEDERLLEVRNGHGICQDLVSAEANKLLCR